MTTKAATKTIEGDETPEALHDAAITATEAWQESPSDETKKAAKDAVVKAKDAATKAKDANAKTQKETADAKTKSDKEAETAKSELLKYEGKDLTLPQDSQLGEAHLEKTVAEAKKLGLSKEGAQALLERDNATIQAHTEAQDAAKDEIVDGWLQLVKDDKDLGGTKEKTEATAILVKKVVDRFGSKALKEKLVETGLGNYPELVRFFRDVGKSMTAEQLVLPGASAVTKDTRTPAERLYGGEPKPS